MAASGRSFGVAMAGRSSNVAPSRRNLGPGLAPSGGARRLHHRGRSRVQHHQRGARGLRWWGGCNTSMYCSSYSTSTVASIIFIQCWLQYKPNSMKMVFSTNEVESF
jgi:hypothetical protein